MACHMHVYQQIKCMQALLCKFQLILFPNFIFKIWSVGSFNEVSSISRMHLNKLPSSNVDATYLPLFVVSMRWLAHSTLKYTLHTRIYGCSLQMQAEAPFLLSFSLIGLHFIFATISVGLLRSDSIFLTSIFGGYFVYCVNRSTK